MTALNQIDRPLLDAQPKPTSDPYLDLLKKTLTASLYDESAWRILEHHRLGKFGSSGQGALRKIVYRLAIRLAGKDSLFFLKKDPFNPADRAEGRDWPLFGYTMAGHKRLDNVQHCVEDVLSHNTPGDFIETGVWRGGTAIFMRALLKHHNVTNRLVWAADSFQGLPVPKSKADGGDHSKTEILKVSLEQVKANFARFALLDDQVRFLKGWFADTLPNAPITRLAILRLDGDMYSSTMDALTTLYHRVSPGGYVIVDDYYSWVPCRNAVTDFLKKNRLSPDIQTIDWTGAYWKVQPTT